MLTTQRNTQAEDRKRQRPLEMVSKIALSAAITTFRLSFVSSLHWGRHRCTKIIIIRQFRVLHLRGYPLLDAREGRGRKE